MIPGFPGDAKRCRELGITADWPIGPSCGPMDDPLDLPRLGPPRERKEAQDA